MSVESEILRIQHNIANTYAAVSEKGGEVPLQPNSANLAESVASIPSGGTDFTPDDTLTLAGGTLSVTTPVQGIFTQDEYDALPEAQKNKGLYVIPGEGGGSSGEIYSTEETRIGTWIDGKPLYKKTFVGVTESKSGEQNFADISSLNIEDCVNTYGFIKRSSNVFIPTLMFYSESNFVSTFLQGRYLVLYNSSSLNFGKPAHITLQYTKTTDPAPTQEVNT